MTGKGVALREASGWAVSGGGGQLGGERWAAVEVNLGVNGGGQLEGERWAAVKVNLGVTGGWRWRSAWG